MTARIGTSHRLVTRKDGRVVIEKDQKAALARLPLNKQIAARKSKRVKVVRMGRAK